MPLVVVIAIGNLIVLNTVRLFWVIRGLVSIRYSPSIVRIREPTRRQVPANAAGLRNDTATAEGTNTLPEVKVLATTPDIPGACHSTAVSAYPNDPVTSEPEQLSSSDRERSASPVLLKRSKQPSQGDNTSPLARQSPEELFAGRAHEVCPHFLNVANVSLTRYLQSQRTSGTGTCTTSRSSSSSSTWSTSSSITQYA